MNHSAARACGFSSLSIAVGFPLIAKSLLRFFKNLIDCQLRLKLHLPAIVDHSQLSPCGEMCSLFFTGASADLSFFVLGDSTSTMSMKSLRSLMLLRTPSLPVILPFDF